MSTAPAQLELFAWLQVHGCSPAAQAPIPTSMTCEDMSELSTEALLETLATSLDDPSASRRVLPALIGEIERRGDARAGPGLVAVMRLHAGFDRERAVPEAAAAVRALRRIGAQDEAGAVLRLVRQGGFGPAAMAEALRYLAAARHRPATDFARHCLMNEHPEVRAAACDLAAALRLRDQIDMLSGLRSDNDRRVSDAAALALGRLGWRPVKATLEAMLAFAGSEELPAILEALVPVADDGTAVLLGRRAFRAGVAVRCAIVRALGEIEAGSAVTWLSRLAADSEPEVRLATVEALAGVEDPGGRTPLRRLAEDPDPQIRAAALAALRDAGEVV